MSPDRRDAHAPALVIHRPAQDLDRHGVAVGVQSVDFVGLLETCGDALARLLPVLGHDEGEHVPTDHVGDAVADQMGQGGVGVEEAPAGMDRDALEGRIDQILQPGGLADAAIREVLIEDRAGQAEDEQQNRNRGDRGREQRRGNHACLRQRHERARRQLERSHRREVQGADADDEQQSAEAAVAQVVALQRDA
jgi:hypothetical protein